MKFWLFILFMLMLNASDGANNQQQRKQNKLVSEYVDAFRSGFKHNHDAHNHGGPEACALRSSLRPLRSDMVPISLRNIPKKWLRKDGNDTVTATADTKDSGDDSVALMVIGVMSARENFSKRQLVRQTWLTLLDKEVGDTGKLVRDFVVVKFIVGEHGCNVPVQLRKSGKCEPDDKLAFHANQQRKQNRKAIDEYDALHESKKQANTSVRLLEEAARHQDIVLLDHIDDYRGLAHKVIHFYEFVSKYVRTRWLMKTDDDALVLVDKLVVELLTNEKLREARRSIWTCVREGMQKHREGKWKENVFEMRTYPPVPTSTASALTSDFADMLVANHDNLMYFANEDVAHGIWAQAFDIRWLHDTRMAGPRCRTDAFVRPFHESALKSMQRVFDSYDGVQLSCHRSE